MTSVISRIPGDSTEVLALVPFELTSVGIIDTAGTILVRVVIIYLLLSPMLGAKDAK